jgi:hypothetical protein
VPAASNATVLAYTFSSDASLTFNDSNTEAISGTFDFDTSNNALTGSITVTGNAPESGVYSGVETGGAGALFSKPNILSDIANLTKG